VESNAAPSVPSLPVRLFKVFVSPGELFEGLRHKPVWFGALAVGAVLVAVSMALIPMELWEEMLREQAMEQSMRTGQPVPDNFGATSNVVRIFSIIGPLVTLFIWAFLLTSIVTFIFAFVLGDEGTYKQYLSVVSHGMFIGAVGGLLITPLRIMEQDIQLTLSLGTFFSFGEGYFSRVMRMMDLFQLWASAVMAIGATKIYPRRGLKSALVVFLGLAVLMALLFGLFPQ
jgi:hypothetical protein